jgi:hypothetical protein
MHGQGRPQPRHVAVVALKEGFIQASAPVVT